MPGRDVLRQLSVELSEKERVTLLRRINGSLKSDSDKETEADAKEKELLRKRNIEREISSLGWFSALIMHIVSKISGRKLDELIIGRKMKNLKKSINSRNAGLTGFERRNLTPQLAEAVFDLYSFTFAFRDLYLKLWLQQGVYDACSLFIMKSTYPNAKSALDDFISMDEAVSIYSETGRQDLIMRELERRIIDYCDSVPKRVYQQIDRSLVPLFALKDIILFPYVSFFQKFGFTPSASGGDKKHYFKNASAMLCLQDLKMLYTAVNIGLSLDEDAVINPQLIKFIGSLDEAGDIPDNYTEHLVKLIRKLRDFNRQIPLLEMLRYFRKDPFLHIPHRLSQTAFRDTYLSILRKMLQSELKSRYKKIQAIYIDREIERIFKGERFIEFRNYRKYASLDHQKMGLPFFTHTKTLNLLYNYIRCFYQSHFSDLVSILEKGLLAQDRISRDRLLNHSVALQELEEKIAASDRSLSPNEEDGKLFHKLRMTLAAEPSQQRLYRNLVVQKNRDVKTLVQWGEEAMSGLQKIFEEIADTNSQSIKMQLNKHYLMRGKSTTLISLLKTRAVHLQEIRRLISQVEKIELEL